MRDRHKSFSKVCFPKSVLKCCFWSACSKICLQRKLVCLLTVFIAFWKSSEIQSGRPKKVNNIFKTIWKIRLKNLSSHRVGSRIFLKRAHFRKKTFGTFDWPNGISELSKNIIETTIFQKHYFRKKVRKKAICGNFKWTYWPKSVFFCVCFSKI